MIFLLHDTICCRDNRIANCCWYYRWQYYQWLCANATIDWITRRFTSAEGNQLSDVCPYWSSWSSSCCLGQHSQRNGYINGHLLLGGKETLGYRRNLWFHPPISNTFPICIGNRGISSMLIWVKILDPKKRWRQYDFNDWLCVSVQLCWVFYPEPAHDKYDNIDARRSQPHQGSGSLFPGSLASLWFSLSWISCEWLFIAVAKARSLIEPAAKLLRINNGYQESSQLIASMNINVTNGQ